MVDRVEFALLDQIEQVRAFDDCDAVVFEQARHSSREAVEIRHVSEHVVREKDIGAIALVEELVGQLLREKGVERSDSRFLRLLGGAVRRVDSEHGNTRLERSA